MAKNRFLDFTGLSAFKDKIIEKITSHTSDNNVHISSEEKTNLSNSYSHSQSEHAPTDAEKNTIVGVQKNGTDLEIDESTRKVDIAVPTKLSELENDLGLSGDSVSIIVDSELSETSENPVQNKIIKESLDNKLDKNNPEGTGSLSLNRKNGTVKGDNSVAVGENIVASGIASFAEGKYTQAIGEGAHAEGYYRRGVYLEIVEGQNGYRLLDQNSTFPDNKIPLPNWLNGYYWDAGEESAIELGSYPLRGLSLYSVDDGTTLKATIEKTYTVLNGNNYDLYAIIDTDLSAEITANPDKGYYIYFGKSSGQGSHSEGGGIALGTNSHAEGSATWAAHQAHSEGFMSAAMNTGAHAENIKNAAYGKGSHAEGNFSKALGDYSHTEGVGTVTNSTAQHAQGKYNVKDEENKYAHIVGGGTSDTDRKNIHTLDWDGNAEFAGDVIATKEDGNKVSLLEIAESISNNDTDINIDSELSSESTNPVQNVVIKNALDELRNETIDVLANAKTYADSIGVKVKDELLNGAGDAYDTLSELGDLIDDNQDAIEVLETVALGKADKTHSHVISDITNLQSELDNKASYSHGTHVLYSSASPVMDGTASVGTATTVARSDHKHPTDTSRASVSDLTSHTDNTTSHITSTERTNWDLAKTHADSAHAPSNAQANQNAFSNVKVGSTTVVADTITDTLELVAGSNVTITPDATNDKITISSTDTTYADATTSTSGLMSSADKSKLDTTNVAYGTCSTSATTTAKVVTISGNANWKLVTGSKIVVKFTYTNTASNPTLNVNSTGAKSISFNGSTITTSNLIYAGISGKYMEFTYDGTYYVFTGMAYIPSYLGFGYGTCSTSASTTAKTATLSNYELTTHGMVSVKFTYAVPASATLNINSKGAKSIYHRGSAITAGVINAGDIATFVYSGSYYYLISIDKAIDTTVTSGSVNYVTSGAVYTAINNAVGDINSVLDAINRTEV